jgi:hypothetical protein
MIDEYLGKIKKKMENANKKLLDGILERQETAKLEDLNKNTGESPKKKKRETKNKINSTHPIIEEEVELLNSDEDEETNTKNKTTNKKQNTFKIYEEDEEIQNAV